MHITITFIELRHVFKFFALSGYALKILGQLKKEKGFKDFKKTGIGKLHFTLTVWETEEDLKRFARSGAHLEAMKQSASMAAVVGTYTYQADVIPGWAEAKQLVKEKGHHIKF